MRRIGLFSLILLSVATHDATGWQLVGKLSNQEVALKIATALRDADLQGRDITIEFKGGVATLEGVVDDSAQKQKASDVTSRIPGVKETVNLLKVGQKGSGSEGQSAAKQSPPVQGDNSQPGLTNQQMAEKIASALGDAGFRGYDISITFHRGVATLEGNVAVTKQKDHANEVVSRIPGVEKTVNSLKVSEDENQVAPGILYVGNAIPQPVTEDLEFPSDQTGDESLNDVSPSLFACISPMTMTMASQSRLGKKLMARQQELFESETLHKIEVSTLHKDKSTPLYDLYCGRKKLVVVSRSGGSNFASFEGRFLNSFRGGVYEWKSRKKTGTQYDCEEQDLLKLFRYSTDVGGFMTGLYMRTKTHPELFKKPIEREDGVKEFRLKEPYYNFLAIADSDDPLWLCELTKLNSDGDEVKRVYSRPAEVDELPEAITRELKDVTFKPTKRTVHSLMVYP